MKNKLKKTLDKDRLARDVLVFFEENQASIESAGGLSRWINNDQKKVQSSLDKLVALGVLGKYDTGSMKGYSYTQDKRIMKIVKEVISK